MSWDLDRAREITRRHFFGQASVGVGALALATLLEREARAGAAGTQGAAARGPHFAPRAKSVIYMHMAGSPPQQELFDYKPALIKFNDQPCPEQYLKGERFAFIKGTPKLLGTPYKFEPRGQCGTLISELLPNLSRCADDIALVRSMHTDFFNHAPAQLFLYTGTSRFGNPSMGSWITYGLGSDNENLPGFVVLVSYGKTPDGGKSLWGSGFLPSIYQGVQCRTQGEPVLYVQDPKGMSRPLRRRTLDALADLNRLHHERTLDPETVTRIGQYEMAFRMQIAVPEAMDISKEPKHVLEAYGAQPGATSFANNCLLARRLVEQGVRCVQLFDWGWDAHGTSPGDDIVHQLPKKCKETDQAMAALIADLKARGLLDETLIVWSGEFGRTPMNERRNDSKYLGRDHHPHCFSVWLAGGGVKGGITYGETDELGYFVARDPVHVHDLQATILNLLGMDHNRLTFKYLGLDQRLTGVTRPVRVVREILA
ncbi:MAG: DUF1501 domain-containing protein [Planctomycetes bacterium]|nr:DUF1501 domain-containing protein [Planctomycetota bacterium]